MSDRFDRFTEQARRVLQLAQEEAQRFNHNYIGTEHLLLGLIREQDGVAARVLTELGVELNNVRDAVEFIIGRGDRTVAGDLGLTPRTKAVIELAVDTAGQLNHQDIGTEHLLLGLVREGDGIAAGILESLGATMERVWESTLDVLDVPVEARPKPPVSPLPESTAKSLRQWLVRDPRQRQTRGTAQPSDRFDRFTERARRVLQVASQEAERLQHSHIGPEHLLLGLFGEGQGVAAGVLRDLGVEMNALRAAVEQAAGRGERTATTPLGLSDQAKKVIELSVDEARRLNHHYIGTEHLLLGLLREGGGIAAGVLQSLGVSLDRATSHVMGVLHQAAAPGRSPEEMASAPPPGSAAPGAVGLGLGAASTERGDSLTEARLPARNAGASGLVEVTVDSIRVQLANYQRMVVLRERDGRQCLSFSIGHCEADQIALPLQHVPITRPMTHVTMRNLVEAAGARLLDVRIERFADEIFYANIRLAIGTTIRMVDARPSDALALALHAGVPILVDQGVLAAKGEPCENPAEGASPSGEEPGQPRPNFGSGTGERTVQG